MKKLQQPIIFPASNRPSLGAPMRTPSIETGVVPGPALSPAVSKELSKYPDQAGRIRAVASRK